MRMALRLALSLIPLAGWAGAQAPTPHPSHTPPPAAPAASPAQAGADDPLLADLIRQALAMNPDLAQARTLVEADQERVPQAGTLPDPVLSLGIQNDGLKKIQVGEMETSYYQIMVTQGLPWPGKRAKRREVARIGAQETEAATERTRLTVEADVRRAYVGLLLIRGQEALLDQQALFLRQAEASARSRYEVGQGAQADLLRAQLERTRTEQARAQQHSQERTLVATLNRLRGKPADTPIGTDRTLAELPDPAPVAPDFQAQAEARSPELKAARLGTDQAQASLDLARLDRRPDFSVSAGYMPRGGLDPMWTASVGITLPLWQKNKQKRAVAEQEYRHSASGWAVEQLRCLLEQRLQERTGELEAALQVLSLYRSGLLVQSEGAFRATLAQYVAGKAPFLSVLETLTGWVADQSGMLQAQAQAQAVRIALDELNLNATPAISAGTLSGASMGAAAKGAGPASGKAGGRPAAGGGEGGGSSMSTM
jgi:outer membrane protein, heavy metal efflux system